MRKLIPISDVVPGMVIVRITQQHGPVKIKKSGLVTSADMVQGLSEMGVSEVEVDLDQTVELADEPAGSSGSEPSQTQTQALLQGQYDRQGHYDNQLADQFNRNLFLPSVQGIPSVWAVYARQAAVVLCTVLVGLTLGFGAGNPSFFFAAEPSESVEDIAANSPQDDTAEVASLTTAEQPQPQTPAQIPAQMPVQQPNVNGLQADPVPSAAPAPDQFPVANSTQPITVANSSLQDGEVAVSPELLRRFNQAIEELDSEPASARNDTQVTVHNDVMRIDQLPVRLMTTLPAMTFSTHMYATRKSDRWVRVNGLRMQEGDVIDDKVQIIAIEPQRVVLGYQGEVFAMAALTDW